MQNSAAMLNRMTPLIALAFQGSRRTNAIAAPVITVVIIAVSTGIGVLLMDQVLFPTKGYLGDESLAGAAWLFMDLALGFGPVILIVWMWLRFFESRPFSSIGFTRGRVLMKLLGGAALGLAIVSVCFVLMALPGTATVDLSLNNNLPGATALVSGLIVAAGWTIQASAEEMLLRGWLLQTTALRYGLVAGIAISSSAFMLIHFMGGTNTGLSSINLVIGGIFYALYALYQGSIWGVCALHAAMNWSEQHLFGFGANSGTTGGSILELQASGADFITGGSARTGAAGGVPYTIVLLVGVVILLLLFRRKSKASSTAYTGANSTSAD